MSEDKESVFRNVNDSGSARDAYDELKNWVIDELQPELKKTLRAKVDDLARKHGVERKKIYGLLYRPPAGETRNTIIDFIYDTLF